MIQVVYVVHVFRMSNVSLALSVSVTIGQGVE
jgi:hypothetical protein